MSDTILKVENVSKQYRLGLVGTGTLSHDLNRWWHRIRGKEDPFLKIGDTNDRSTKGSSAYVWALKDINFEVQNGEVLGIIGKNGAGKSTLLKILSRVTSPSTGEIKTKGRIASLLEVGTGFHPELTGLENIYLNGAILGMTKAEIKQKEEAIIEFSGCERYIDTPVKRYSSGMRVRLAFAVAAFLEPDILVVDEVLAVGDAEFQIKAVGKMQDISRTDGRTVLFVSHNMAAVSNLCTRLIVLENGTVKFEGNVDEGISEYLNQMDNKKEHDFPIQLQHTIFEHFTIRDHLSNTSNKLLLGKSCAFELGLINTSKDSIKYLVRLQLFDDKGDLVVTLNTHHKVQNHIALPQERFVMSCHVDQLLVASGTYFIGLMIMNIETKSEYYVNDKFSKLEILNGDVYNTGILPNNKNMGKLIQPHNWVVK